MFGQMAVGPAWTRGEIEKPAGTKNMGSWMAAIYTEEQQKRLGVNASGQKVQPAPAPIALLTSCRPAPAYPCGVVGPAWIGGGIEKPAGTKNMGSWTAAVFTEEQQRRLGVNASGQKVQAAPAPVALVASSRPASIVQKPAGTKDLGAHGCGHEGEGHGHEGHRHAEHGGGDGHGHTSGCCNGHDHDSNGEGHSHNGHGGQNGHSHEVLKAKPAEFAEYAVKMPVTITPQYAAALLNSPILLRDLCSLYFKKYDTNKSGILEFGEIKNLCHDLHKGLDLSFSDVDDEAIKTSIRPFSKGDLALLADDLPAWFTTMMRDSISTTPQEQHPAELADMQVKVRALSAQDEYVLYGFSDVLSSMAVGTLREITASHLDLPLAQTILTLGDEVLTDSTTMEEMQILPESEIVVRRLRSSDV